MVELMILIVGGTSGIGHALAIQLAATGHRVETLSRATVRVGQHHTCDVRDLSSLRSVFSEMADAVEVVVNAAGVGYYAPIVRPDSDVWMDILETNVVGLANLLSLTPLLPRLRTFVQISSTAAHGLTTTPGNEMYAASKAAARSLLEHHRADARHSGVQFHSISPGYVAGTEFGNRFFSHTPDDRVDLYSGVPSLKPEVVASTIAFMINAGPTVEFEDVILRPRAVSA